MIDRPMYPADNLKFTTLSDDTRVWLYAADRRLTSQQAEAVRARLRTFMATWDSHARNVVSELALVDNRLLVVGAEVPGGSISGCGIDKSLHTLDSLARELDFVWVNGLHIVYRDQQGQYQTASRSEFKTLAARGEVDGETPVVDLAMQHLGHLRGRGLEVPLATSWHSRFLGHVPTTSDSAT